VDKKTLLDDEGNQIYCKKLLTEDAICTVYYLLFHQLFLCWTNCCRKRNRIYVYKGNVDSILEVENKLKRTQLSPF
jgi:hypothetical protein